MIYETSDKLPSFGEKNNSYRTNMSVFHSYKSQLKAYSKKRFDPFCRRDRLLFNIDDDHSIESTIGQLNFFKWALEYKIIDYITDNLEAIEKDMNKRNSSSKDRKKAQSKTRKKRKELSVSATKSIKKENVIITVKFD